MGRTGDRVRRMLSVVPYVVQHQGIELSELARVFDVPPEQLRADLDLLTMTGVPPYDPGTLIDLDLDDLEQGRVTLRMADHLRSASRLTRPEAISLYLRGKALLATPGLAEAPALASALDKIEGAVDGPTLEELHDRVQADTHPVSHDILDEVRACVAGSEGMEIDYYAASRDELRSRTIEPEKVYSHDGRWYVVAWDLGEDAERLFRVSRIRTARRTGQRFEPRGLEGAGRALYSVSGDDVSVRLRLSPAARWVAEYYETQDEVETGQALEVTMPAGALAGIAKLILRLGSDAEVLEPDELRAEVADLAARTLALYRG